MYILLEEKKQILKSNNLKDMYNYISIIVSKYNQEFKIDKLKILNTKNFSFSPIILNERKE